MQRAVYGRGHVSVAVTLSKMHHAWQYWEADSTRQTYTHTALHVVWRSPEHTHTHTHTLGGWLSQDCATLHHTCTHHKRCARFRRPKSVSGSDLCGGGYSGRGRQASWRAESSMRCQCVTSRCTCRQLALSFLPCYPTQKRHKAPTPSAVDEKSYHGLSYHCL